MDAGIADDGTLATDYTKMEVILCLCEALSSCLEPLIKHMLNNGVL